ncbi:gastrula zinc finger protein XlCGF17.1-like [Achroia grisella]|uniref:gastrula zinc finger protein XlCGF17.1-like n=1 Tax=Achroia grisella TaxID=688607 RepID=UPI0027D2CA98|nr:gastrula zinc finger protein XlCGF17.1-like [Achroia grisella]
MASAYFIMKIIRRKRQKALRKQLSTIKIDKEFELNKNKDFQKCRICLNKGNIPIFSSQEDISQDIRIFGDIDISEYDEYPKYLCNSCHSLLQGAIIFRKSAKDSDRFLRNSSNFSDEQSSNTFLGDENGAKDIINELSPDSYNCKTCNIKYSTKEEYLLHKNSKQHRNVRIQCSICYRLLTVQLYNKHLERHQSASHLICEVCGKLYRKDNLFRHLQLHSFDLPFKCQMCPYRGRFLESLKIHMRTHTGDKPFSCDKCELRFLTRSNLNRHLLTHKKDRPYKCMECGRGFYTKHDMGAHFKSDHAGIKDFGCKLCGNKYGTRKALMRHELRVHKRDKMAKGRMPLYLQAEYRKPHESL